MLDLNIGNKVQVKYNSFCDKEYDSLNIGARKQHNNDVGYIVDINVGHGICFEIQFALGRAWYEPSELIKLEKNMSKVVKYQWEGRLESYLSDSGVDTRKDERCTPSKPKIRISYDDETKVLCVERRIPSDEDAPQYISFDPQLLNPTSILKEMIKAFRISPVTRSNNKQEILCSICEQPSNRPEGVCCNGCQ